MTVKDPPGTLLSVLVPVCGQLAPYNGGVAEEPVLQILLVVLALIVLVFALKEIGM